MQIPEARWIVLGTLLLFALMIAVYVSFYFRDLAVGESEDSSTELLTDFRRMRDEGYLDEDEYSRTKNQMRELGDATVAMPEKQAEKKYLTLAEAQQLKEQPSSESEENSDQEKESGDSTSE